MLRYIVSALLLLSIVPPAFADQHYSREVFFANSLSPGFDPYTEASFSTPSTLEMPAASLRRDWPRHGHLPVETSHFVSGPNALRLSWTSAPNGGWSAQINVYRFRNRDLDWQGNTLSLWLWSEVPVAPTALPNIAFADLEKNHTAPLPLSRFRKDAIPANQWTRVLVPLDSFTATSLRAFNPRHLTSIVLSQRADDNQPHTFLLDEIRILTDNPSLHTPPATPTHLEAEAYERHIDLHWTDVPDPRVADYVIYRSLNGGRLQPIGVQRPGPARFADYLGDPHATATYRVTARTSALAESPQSTPITASTHPMSDDDLLTMVQRASFRYYWEAAEPHSGMARESEPGDDDIIALGASGFGIMASVVAVDRHFVPREQAVARLLQITRFLEHADRYHGAWPHFLSGSTGHTIALFQIYDDGADLVETSFLMEGLLTARQYFSADTPGERELRERITQLWQGVDWDWFRATPNRDALYWHWSPVYAFQIANRLEGWNEVMITYLLAIASPTHPVPASLYTTGYTRVGTPDAAEYGRHHTWYDIPLTQTYGPSTPGPLFFTQYSFMAYDPRGERDRFSNYFVQNRNESLISEAYSVANPGHFAGYGANSWGLTAVDGPDDRYHEYKPFSTDDGTLAPTGAVSAFAYTPDRSRAAILHWYRDLGAQVWDIYGFRDSFNQTHNWYSGITMGLNQAPQTVMIENGRTGLIWHTFMSNPEIPAMQHAIGLTPDPTNQNP